MHFCCYFVAMGSCFISHWPCGHSAMNLTWLQDKIKFIMKLGFFVTKLMDNNLHLEGEWRGLMVTISGCHYGGPGFISRLRRNF